MFGQQDDNQQQPQGDGQQPEPQMFAPADTYAQPPVSDSQSTPLIEPIEPDGVAAGQPQASPAAADNSAPASSDDLLNIKQQALQQLTPLVGHLEQSPEEKFRTTMMLIQASDNQSLIKVAYEAANKISDEKLRAQALLDVVNEINYFTQH